MKRILLVKFLSFSFLVYLQSQSLPPTGLLCQLLAHPELSVISSKDPDFGWIVNSTKQGDYQYAYHILVASSPFLLRNGQPDMWDTGRVRSAQSINVKYAGKPLSPNASYWWKVKTYCKKSGESEWSKMQRFNTSNFSEDKNWPGESKWLQIEATDGELIWTFENRHPVIYSNVKPIRQTIRSNGVQYFDFGRAAFSNVEMNLTWIPSDLQQKELQLIVNIGEKGVGDSIDQKPGGGVIFRTYEMTVKPGTANYTLEIPRFVPRYPHSQPMPPQMPEVAPFRFLELMAVNEILRVNDITQKTLYYIYNESAAHFSSSNNDLNAIYSLCKYSTIANTFNGDYASSERERMMYEADSYIQQMGHYAIDREFAIARYSLENLIYHASWPTEWISHSIFMAWADYLYTGNINVLQTYYNDLKAKTMMALETDMGLISTRTGLQTKEFLSSIHFNGSNLNDIVDWPHGSMSTIEGGETDNYEFMDYNTVVNAFYYQSLVYMSKIAAAIGNTDDALFFEQKSGAVKNVFNKNFLDTEMGVYVDGIGSGHASLHANMFPLCFGLVPADNQETVINHIKSKGMACGVYASNYLLEALFDCGQTDYAFQLLTSDSDRSWLNMIRVGATMTTEAWDNKYKVNNGWSHAWSASPVHIIPRKIMGVEPVEPGFGKFVVRPKPGNLTWAKTRVPTIRGDIDVSFEQNVGKTLVLRVVIPANTTASVYIPSPSVSYKLKQNGKARRGRYQNNFVLLENIKPGNHLFEITYQTTREN